MAELGFRFICPWFQNPHLHPNTWTWCVSTRKGGKRKQYPLVIKLAAQGKHSAESTDAVCLELLCVPGEAASCFSWWIIHHLEPCVYFCCCPPSRWGRSTAIHKSRVIGWEHNTENARGLFIVQNPRLKRRHARSLIISQGIWEDSGQWQ